VYRPFEDPHIGWSELYQVFMMRETSRLLTAVGQAKLKEKKKKSGAAEAKTD
jgi:hypothetical protein